MTVNGRVATLGESATAARDQICLDGVELRAEPLRYWLLHKPAGVLTSVRDPEGRPTVVDLLPERSVRLVPVGRLDLDTEGLVLLTNDGATAHALLHPRHGCEREYVVTVRGAPARETLRRLEDGIELDDGPTAPAKVRDVVRGDDGATTRFRLVLREGRKRQIRRSLVALGHRVIRLVRIRIGPLVLGDLAPGAARPLAEDERRALLHHAERLRAGATNPENGREGRKEAVRATRKSGQRASSARSSGRGHGTR